MPSVESLDEETYEQTRKLLIFFFERRGCRSPAELADETFFRVVTKITHGEEVLDITKYCYGVARNVLREHWKNSKKAWVELEEPLVASRASEAFDVARQHEESEQQRRRLACMEECARKLDARDRELITTYCTVDDRRELAARLGLTLNALRLRVLHIRGRLKKCRDQCLKNAPGTGN